MLASRGLAADRAAATPAVSPMADITDVYAWMSGSKLNLVMDVSSHDDGMHAFGPTVLYAFHLTSKPRLGLAEPAGTETQVICRFDSNTMMQCWVVSGGAAKDYVIGDPSTAGVTSPSGRVKVFAGRRSDPAFFNLSGFNTATAGFAPQLGVPGTTDNAGCPGGVPPDKFVTLRTQLGNPPGTGSDSFLMSNVMAIVVQIDPALVNTSNNTVVAVWGSTHAGQ